MFRDKSSSVFADRRNSTSKRQADNDDDNDDDDDVGRVVAPHCLSTCWNCWIAGGERKLNVGFVPLVLQGNGDTRAS